MMWSGQGDECARTKRRFHKLSQNHDYSAIICVIRVSILLKSSALRGSIDPLVHQLHQLFQERHVLGHGNGMNSAQQFTFSF